jgi:CRP-like cAMP-binding protein
MVSGKVRIATADEDQQEVVVDEPEHGQFFGFASMLKQTPHQTTAIALEETTCLEVSRSDIEVFLRRSLWRAWICSLPLVISSMWRSIWCGCVHCAISMRLSKRNQPSACELPTLSRASVVRGLYHLLLSCTLHLRGGQCCVTRQSMGSVSVHPAQPVSLHTGLVSGAGHHDEPESPGQ